MIFCLPTNDRLSSSILSNIGFRKNGDRKSTRLNSSHLVISYAVFCLKKKNPAYGGPRIECNTPRERGRAGMLRHDHAVCARRPERATYAPCSPAPSPTHGWVTAGRPT